MSRNADLQMVSTVKERWRNGERADAQRILDDHPQLMEAKSIVLDLAYEEYCQRTAAGEAVDPTEFCRRFSRFRASLGRRIEVHELLRGELGYRLGDENDAWPDAGDIICGYRLIEELGRGMVGRVFLAEELGLACRQVVVKLTRAGVHEAETLSRLSHPNIVPIYSTQHEPLTGVSIICMPYLGRHTLQDLLDAAFVHGTAPETLVEITETLRGAEEAVSYAGAHTAYIDNILAIGIALCEALAHTHSKGVLHLDLKPSNVLLSAGGTPLLLDFNLSLDGEARWSLMGGTMPYMSPEQIQSFVLGDTEVPLDARSDIFSLGVIIYQLVTGIHPFSSVNWRQTPERIGEELLDLQAAGAAPAHTHDARISRSLSRILASAMSSNIADRPANANQFADLLRTELGPQVRWKRFLRKHRLKLLSLGLLLLTISASAVWAVALREPFDVREMRHAWQALERAEDDAALLSFGRVLEFNPDSHEGYFGRGRAHQRLGRFDEAYRDFTQAHDRFADGRYSACRGFSASATGRDDLALARYQEAIGEGFATREVWLCKGRSHARLGQTTPAESSMLKAVEIDPQYSTAWHNLAILYQGKLRNLTKAQACIEQAISGDEPKSEMFLSGAMLAWMESKTGGSEKIRKYVEEGIQHGLSWRECEGRPFLKALPQNDPVIAMLKSRPNRKDSAVLGPDPLGDSEIARRAMSGR